MQTQNGLFNPWAAFFQQLASLGLHHNPMMHKCMRIDRESGRAISVHNARYILKVYTCIFSEKNEK